MVLTFADQATRDIFEKLDTKAARKTLPSTLHAIAKRKLDHLAFASVVQDLKWPPGNRLEKLKGDLNGFYSIRINDQWRIIFRWDAARPSEVRIVDYH